MLLVGSTKFAARAGTVVCGQDEVDIVVTDAPPDHMADGPTTAGVEIVRAA